MGEKKIRAVSKIFALIIRQTIEYVIYYSTVIHFSSILAYNYNFDGLIRAPKDTSLAADWATLVK